MPVCTNCAHPADHVYTTYATKSNVRLGVCPRCDAFLDPLIEHPPLLILLDLVLLKPRVYLHLLFNRGAPPLDAEAISGSRSTTPTPSSTDTNEHASSRARAIYTDLAKLGTATIAAESIVRLLPLLTAGDATWTIAMNTLLVVLVEYVSQHMTTTVLAMAALWARGWYPCRENSVLRDGRQENFLPALIPLTLLYATLLPLLLQLFLSIWYTPPPSIHEPLPSNVLFSPLSTLPSPLLSLLPPSFLSSLRDLEASLVHAWAGADRVWAGTRLLSGMSSGFGLRVLLPTKPAETTLIVLAGWMAAAVSGRATETVLIQLYS